MNKIVIARKKLGLNQEQLAKKMGIPRSALAQWETEKYFPSNKNLKLLSKFLKLPKDYFLKDQEPEISKYDILKKEVENLNLKYELLKREIELLKK
ncbi:MAG: helix-turn-helix domain-containing protein [Endomicrobium sp.]|nr:helix-turn-helix domain-containing protein [Endomicrobium sp.]